MTRGRGSDAKLFHSLGIAGLEMGIEALLGSRASKFNPIGGLCHPIPAFCANVDHAKATAMPAKNRLRIRNSEETKSKMIANTSLSVKRSFAMSVRVL